MAFEVKAGSGITSGAGLVVLAGAIAFFGSMKEAGSWPSNGVRVITATILLAIIISIFDNGPLIQPIKWLGYLMVLSAAIRYVPKLSAKKGK